MFYPWYSRVSACVYQGIRKGSARLTKDCQYYLRGTYPWEVHQIVTLRLRLGRFDSYSLHQTSVESAVPGMLESPGLTKKATQILAFGQTGYAADCLSVLDGFDSRMGRQIVYLKGSIRVKYCPNRFFRYCSKMPALASIKALNVSYLRLYGARYGYGRSLARI